MKKSIIIISAIIVLLVAAVAAMTMAYKKSDAYTSSILPNNTTINGIDCSELNYAQAKEKLTSEWNKSSVAVTGTLKDKLANFTDFQCSYAIDKSLKDIKRSHMITAAFNHFLKLPFNANFPMQVAEYSSEFKERVVTSDFLNNPNATETKDAYVDLTDPKFPIVAEKLGTTVDREKFFKDLLNHIETGEFELLYDEKAYYITPKVTAEDPKLLEYQEFCKKYLKQKITYQMGEATHTLTPEVLTTLFAKDFSGNADQQAVKDYVAQMAKKYNNVGAKRTMKSYTGKTFTVDGGTYGWTIDEDKEAAQLLADVNSHKDVTRKPIYSFESYGDYTQTVGPTYIDIDFSKQQLKFFKDGKEMFSCSVVTGNRNQGNSTPDGTYYVLNKLRNVTMRGDNNDGTQYEAHAAYWMGVTKSGVGMHDAPWRAQFGGSIWISNGSHGCINMPPSAIARLFKMVEKDMPVVMHF